MTRTVIKGINTRVKAGVEFAGLDTGIKWELQETKDVKYTPFVSKTDKPAIFLNKAIMAEFRPEMKKYYYDPTKYGSYLEQLGIKYPTLRTADTQTVDDVK